MAFAHLGGLTLCLELPQRECAHEFEQFEAVRPSTAPNEARFEQALERRCLLAPHDRLERGSIEASAKDARRAQSLLRIGAEHVVAPPDRRRQRLLALGQITQQPAAREQRTRDLTLEL